MEMIAAMPPIRPLIKDSPARHPLRDAWPWGAAVLSGVLLILSYPPFDQGWLIWIALAPLIAAVWFDPDQGVDGSRARARRWRRSALLGYVTGFVFFSGVFYWLAALAPLFSNAFLYGLPPLLGLYMGLYIAFWSWFIARLRPAGAEGQRTQSLLSSHRNLWVGFQGACCWTALEWVRGWLFSGFGWNGLGVALHRNLPIIQIADVAGVLGLTWLVAFCNLLAVAIIARIVLEFGPAFLKHIRWEFSFTMALIGVVFGYGVRAIFVHGRDEGVPLSIASVQPNIPQTQKFDAESEDKTFAQLDRLTSLAAIGNPDLILWPESATPRGMFADEVNYRFVMNQASRTDAALLIGTLDSDPQHSQEFNVAALLSERGARQQIYRKIHLVPFGEYLPLRHSFPPLAMIAGELVPGDFSPGREFTTLELSKPNLRLSALICFEDTLGDLTRNFVKNGAQLLVNITNDGWFGTTAAAEQHLQNAMFRAVETRRPLVRCTNTGVTCTITPAGRVQCTLQPFQEGFARASLKVPATSGLTFYTRAGDLIAHVSALFLAFTLLKGGYRLSRTRKVPA